MWMNFTQSEPVGEEEERVQIFSPRRAWTITWTVYKEEHNFLQTQLFIIRSTGGSKLPLGVSVSDSPYVLPSYPCHTVYVQCR